MQGYNCIMVYSPGMDRLLMCRRLKNPYKGMSNLVGGKIESGEEGLAAAYRELWEETAIPREMIELKHLMDFTYYLQDCYVEVYVGRLREEFAVSGDENTLYWSALDENFFDLRAYAGEGNIGHMVEQVKEYRDVLFPDREKPNKR